MKITSSYVFWQKFMNVHNPVCYCLPNCSREKRSSMKRRKHLNKQNNLKMLTGEDDTRTLISP
ncbi:CLUMA_CG019765, isoform A [Clunio marinus]|uniref:CLUMA_CG019765, isoform A n=1 Tax=Clunio marinus TaxID=568069 RepID=A0A1J1J4A9_9DIPT|nr:CLUMA_CG019765, isoform A [Clunio marinus]